MLVLFYERLSFHPEPVCAENDSLLIYRDVLQVIQFFVPWGFLYVVPFLLLRDEAIAKRV